MKTFPLLLALCEGKTAVTCEVPCLDVVLQSKKPVEQTVELYVIWEDTALMWWCSNDSCHVPIGRKSLNTWWVLILLDSKLQPISAANTAHWHRPQQTLDLQIEPLNDLVIGLFTDGSKMPKFAPNKIHSSWSSSMAIEYSIIITTLLHYPMSVMFNKQHAPTPWIKYYACHCEKNNVL